AKPISWGRRLSSPRSTASSPPTTTTKPSQSQIEWVMGPTHRSPDSCLALHLAQQAVQRAVGDAELVEMANGIGEILDIGPGDARSSADARDDLIRRQLARILAVAAVGDVGCSRERALARRHPHPAGLIDTGHHLALVQIAADDRRARGGNAISPAAAGAAAVEA